MVVCTVCNGRFFTTVAAYEQHVKTSRAHFVFRCTICNASFPSAFARSGHLTKVHQNLLCRQCNRYYLSLDSLQQHYRDDVSHPTCSQCDHGFPDGPALRLHEATAHPKPLVPCAVCNMTFEDQAGLELHWRESDRHPLCLVCDTGFENELRFNSHVQQVHPELWCGACGAGFASSGQLLEHYLEAESAVHPTCTACGEGFETQAILDEHIASRHPAAPPTPPPPTPSPVRDEPNDIVCTVCDRIYRREEDLLRHYKESPSHPKCLSCCEGFLDDQAYHEHVVDIHPAALTIEHHIEVEVSPSLGAASLLTTPHREYVSLGEAPEPIEEMYGSPRTTVPGFSRVMDSDPETASVARRASSEPTPTLPTVNIEVVTPSSQADDDEDSDDELDDYERLDRSAYETPAPVTPSTPARSERSFSYNSGPSTPERLFSPSSLISPRSPIDEDPVPTPPAIPSPRLPRTPRTPLSVRTQSVMSPRSRSSPVFEATAHSYVTALPPLRSSTSKQSLRSIHSPAKAASVKCFSPVARSPVPIAPTFAPRSASQLSNIVPVSEDASPRLSRAEIRQPVPRWGSMTTLPNNVRVSRERRSRAPSPESSQTPVVNPRSQPSRPSSRTMNSSSQTTPSFSPTPKAQSSLKAPLNVTSSLGSKQSSWHCRMCLKEPHDPTVTMCGHLFCHECIVAELAKNLSCPVCRKQMLVRLHVDDN